MNSKKYHGEKIVFPFHIKKVCFATWVRTPFDKLWKIDSTAAWTLKKIKFLRQKRGGQWSCLLNHSVYYNDIFIRCLCDKNVFIIILRYRRGPKWSTSSASRFFPKGNEYYLHWFDNGVSFPFCPRFRTVNRQRNSLLVYFDL